MNEVAKTQDASETTKKLVEIISEHEIAIEGLNNIVSQQNTIIKELEHLLLRYISMEEIAEVEEYVTDGIFRR